MAAPLVLVPRDDSVDLELDVKIRNVLRLIHGAESIDQRHFVAEALSRPLGELRVGLLSALELGDFALIGDGERPQDFILNRLPTFGGLKARMPDYNWLKNGGAEACRAVHLQVNGSQADLHLGRLTILDGSVRFQAAVADDTGWNTFPQLGREGVNTFWARSNLGSGRRGPRRT